MPVADILIALLVTSLGVLLLAISSRGWAIGLDITQMSDFDRFPVKFLEHFTPLARYITGIVGLGAIIYGIHLSFQAFGWIGILISAFLSVPIARLVFKLFP